MVLLKISEHFCSFKNLEKFEGSALCQNNENSPKDLISEAEL